MMKAMAIGAITAAAAASAIALQSHPAGEKGADAAHPVVIELYQSQGCSSCPPALKVLQAEADRSDILALNFAVTYWDHLGWKDRFADPAYTKRQWDYAHAAGRGQVATPQLIVNGRGAVNGGNRAEVDAAIVRWDRGRGGLEIGVAGNMVTIGAFASKGATVWLVDYDPRTIDVPIRAGENEGRTLPHRNIVTGLTRLGAWAGRPARFALPAARPGMQRAVLVQAGSGGPIVAARRIS
ncbi:MAG: DUF1223 domain-containing protein [Proteobacteria bacterium]|nr:DUF1223 domain-containing protein [Pseudomonadota bacterium]